MSVYPIARDAEPTHRAVSRWEAGGGYITIETLDGRLVDTIRCDPYDLPEGDLFRAGYQLVDSWSGDDPSRETARIRPMPREVALMTGARLRLLLATTEDEREIARDLIRRAVQPLIDSGLSEYEVCDMAGVTRMTLRKWLGKS